MVSGTQPDSPVGEWQAVFVGDPTLNRPVVAPEGEHFPPARLDGHRLSSANEATRVATYSPVGGDGVETGAGSAAPGLTGSLPGASDSESGQNGSGQLRASLVAVILGLSGDLWHLPTRTDATVMADAILADGWRRVSVDDDTVERPADGDEGCLCHACERRYRVDFDIPDTLWQRIGMPPESGLLCGRCIAGRIEGLGEFDAFSLVPVVDGDAPLRAGFAVRDAMDRVSAQDYDTAAEAWAEIGRAAVQALRDGGEA